MSPYHAFSNKPIVNIDPNGANDSPVHDSQSGELLGTDDQGLQGDALVMDKSDFKQGMKHKDAVNLDKGVAGLKDLRAANTFSNQEVSLPSRPDYDGVVTPSDGVAWAKQHVGLMQSDNIKPIDALYFDASKMDFGNIHTSYFPKENESKAVNLFNYKDLSSGRNISTVYALGRVDMILSNRQIRTVLVVNNAATVYDWNYGGSLLRNGLIGEERIRNGLNDTHGFPLFVYSQGTLRETPPPSPVRMVGW
jgi:hypothetical protein